jgi:XRE family aerobic/anaerobic benzoate catabolism transcriptional regulator
VTVLVAERLARALGVPLESLFAPVEKDAADLTLIIEFLREQPRETLSEIRHHLVAQFGTAPEQRRRRVALLGMRGAGKSSVGLQLADRLRIPFVELDREVERSAGIELAQIFSLYGQGAYRSFERECLERTLMRHPEVVIATGGGLVTEPQTYELLLRSCYAIWLRATPVVLFDRLHAQGDLRIASGPMHRQAMDIARHTLDARTELYAKADVAVESSELSVAQVVARIEKELRLGPSRRLKATKPA